MEVTKGAGDVLRLFHPAVAEWFRASFAAPTPPQAKGWPAIARGGSTLILAPTGSGKTLAAFLWAIERVMFSSVERSDNGRTRILYISPLKALAVDVERNLRAPLAGIAQRAAARGDTYHLPEVAVRTGDTPAVERARFQREPADILITTPESLYLLLTSNAREALRSIETVIVDEIHAMVPTKRGAHLALSLERLNALTETPPQRIGLSATQRPLDEVARFLGGSRLRRSAATARRAKERQADEAIHDEFTAPRRSREAAKAGDGGFRDVAIVDTSEKKRLELRIEVPVEDMARLGETDDIPSGPAAQGSPRSSIWTAIQPRLLELVTRVVV